MEQSIRNELPGTVNETISEKGAARLTYGNHLVTMSVTKWLPYDASDATPCSGQLPIRLGERSWGCCAAVGRPSVRSPDIFVRAVQRSRSTFVCCDL